MAVLDLVLKMYNLSSHSGAHCQDAVLHRLEPHGKTWLDSHFDLKAGQWCGPIIPAAQEVEADGLQA